MTQTATVENTNTTAAAKANKLAVHNKSTLVRGEDYIEGTIADILGRGQESRLSINRKKVNQPQLSALVALGIASEVGTAARAPGTKGPRPAIVRLPTNIPGITVARR